LRKIVFSYVDIEATGVAANIFLSLVKVFRPKNANYGVVKKILTILVKKSF
jgi:hypothetical protein